MVSGCCCVMAVSAARLLAPAVAVAVTVALPDAASAPACAVPVGLALAVLALAALGDVALVVVIVRASHTSCSCIAWLFMLFACGLSTKRGTNNSRWWVAYNNMHVASWVLRRGWSTTRCFMH